MSARIKDLLEEAGGEMTPARLPENLWYAGRRLHRRDLLLRAMASIAVVSGLFVAVPAVLQHAPDNQQAASDPVPAAVPGRVHLPFAWQAPVSQAPAGPATVMFSGGGTLRGNDFLGGEDRVAVVGRNGSYRMLNGNAGATAGEDVLLSPDGRYVAQADNGPATDGWLLIIDLTTGKTRHLTMPGRPELSGVPVAWAPDGHSLLALRYSPSGTTGNPTYLATFVLVNLDTGATTTLAQAGDIGSVRTASAGAFSPDGHRLALSIGRQLRLVDTAGRTLWTTELGQDRYLAGVGAFTADGGKITIATVHGCVGTCDSTQLGARRWTFGYLDATTGADATGTALAPVHAMAVRALGWSQRTELVVETYQPMPGTSTTAGTPFNDTGDGNVTAAELVALRANGHIGTLLDPPDEVAAIDVPRQLVVAGRFSGADVAPRPLPVARPYIVLGGVLTALPFVAVVVVALLIHTHRRNRRPIPPPVSPPGPGEDDRLRYRP
jgi:hypothetical protein